ncbi:MAG: nucleotide pyrophosphohydrolase [Planctomycetes bacterium]|nr:nucleotide pyrophosphohydrolase [Planctomycetota bacterium]
MDIRSFQDLIRKVYLEKDSARGLDGTFMYFVEEVGELATALREEDRAAQAGEFADVFAWLLSLANLAGIDMEEALEKYKDGGDIHKSRKP